MKRRETTVIGTISNDGKLNLQLSVVPFLQEWKGNKVAITFKVIGGTQSEAMKGYYFNYVVPAMKNAIWESGERKNEKETEQWLREMSPITHIEEWHDGTWITKIKEIAELTNAELSEHIEFIRQMAAEEYGCYIEEPGEKPQEK